MREKNCQQGWLFSFSSHCSPAESTHPLNLLYSEEQLPFPTVAGLNNCLRRANLWGDWWLARFVYNKTLEEWRLFFYGMYDRNIDSYKRVKNCVLQLRSVPCQLSPFFLDLLKNYVLTNFPTSAFIISRCSPLMLADGLLTAAALPRLSA